MRRVLAALVNFISKSIAFIVAALFVVTALLSLLLFNAEWQLLSPGVYKRALAEQDVYERFPELVSEQLMRAANYNPCAENPNDPRCLAEGEGSPPEDPGEAGEGGPPPFTQFLTREDWEAILGLLFEAEWLQAQTERAIDQLFSSLEYESAPVVIAISTKEIRERIGSEAGVEAVMRLIRSAPPCTTEQLAGMVLSGATADFSPLLTCSPPDEVLLMLTPTLQAQLKEVAANIPDQAVMGGAPEEAASPDQGNVFGLGQRHAFVIIRRIIRFSPLLPLALLFVIALFGARSWQGLLGWWGIPLLIVGLIGVGIAVMILPLMDWAILTFAMPKLRESVATENVIAVGLGVGRTIARTLAWWIGGEAGVAGLLGVIMLAVSSFVAPKQSARSS